MMPRKQILIESQSSVLPGFLASFNSLLHELRKDINPKSCTYSIDTYSLRNPQFNYLNVDLRSVISIVESNIRCSHSLYWNVQVIQHGDQFASELAFDALPIENSGLDFFHGPLHALPQDFRVYLRNRIFRYDVPERS